MILFMFKRVVQILFFLFSISLQLYSQGVGFTLDGEFLKQQKKYPFITPAQIGDTSQIQIIRNIYYSSDKKLSQSADVFLPLFGNDVDKELVPVVVLIHGGGWQSGDKALDWPMAAQLARNNIAAVCINYRMSDEAVFPAAIQDVRSAIRWVRANSAKYNIDINNITLLGSSAGGQLAALAGSINGSYKDFDGCVPHKFSCKVNKVVDIDGVLAFIHPDSSEGADTEAKLSSASRWFGVSSYADSTAWAVIANQASAISHVNRNSAQFLFCLSGQTRFSAGVNDMILKLNGFGVKSSVVKYDNSPHTYWLFNPWFEPLMSEIIGFILMN